MPQFSFKKQGTISAGFDQKRAAEESLAAAIAAPGIARNDIEKTGVTESGTGEKYCPMKDFLDRLDDNQEKMSDG